MDHAAIGTGIGNEAAIVKRDDEDLISSHIARECLCMGVTPQERVQWD